MTQVSKGTRLAKPENCPEALWNVIMNCWNADPALRPTFQALNNSIKEYMLNTGTVSTKENYIPSGEQHELVYNTSTETNYQTNG